MRWEALFADLGAQWEAEERRLLDSEIADRTRRERAAISLLDRLAAHRGEGVRVRLVVGEPLDLVLRDHGADWILGRSDSGSEVLVPMAAVVALHGLGPRAVEDRASRRFPLGYALRALARDRAEVTIVDRAGAAVTGTIDSVGADHLDLAEHAAGELRRRENLLGRRTIAYAALVLVRSG